MVVLCGLDGQLDAVLAALNKAGAGPECLKAVLTPHNRNWNAVTLYTELLREKRACREGEEHAPFDFRMPFGLPVPV